MFLVYPRAKGDEWELVERKKVRKYDQRRKEERFALLKSNDRRRSMLRM